MVIPKHCVLSSVQTQPYLHRRFFPGMCVDGRLKCFSASVRRNWHWTAIRYALHRESKGTGCLCHWHISCVQWVLVGSARLKLDITKSVIPFSWKSINAHDYIFLLHAACTFPNEVQPLVFHSCPETEILHIRLPLAHALVFFYSSGSEEMPLLHPIP